MEEDMAGCNEFKKCYFEKKKKRCEYFPPLLLFEHCFRIISRFFEREGKKDAGLFRMENDEEEGSISGCCYTFYGCVFANRS